MKVCIPVTEDHGLQSPVSAHFGSAPLFMIVDIEGGSCRTVPNHNSHRGHGMCQPLSVLFFLRVAISMMPASPEPTNYSIHS